MEEKIEKIFFELTGRDVQDITPKTKLNKLGLSSLSLVEMVCAIEDEFDIEIPNSQILKFKTVGDVKKYLEKKRQSVIEQ